MFFLKHGVDASRVLRDPGMIEIHLRSKPRWQTALKLELLKSP